MWRTSSKRIEAGSVFLWGQWIWGILCWPNLKKQEPHEPLIDPCSVDLQKRVQCGAFPRPAGCCIVVVSRSHVHLCDPMNIAHQAPLSSTIPWNLLKFMSITLVILPDHLILCHPLLFLPSNLPQHQGLFPVSQLLSSGGESIRALASVLSMNIQGSFPLGLTGLSSLQSKRLSRVFSSTMIQQHQFLGTQPLWSRSHIHTWLLGKP